MLWQEAMRSVEGRQVGSLKALTASAASTPSIRSARPICHMYWKRVFVMLTSAGLSLTSSAPSCRNLQHA